jgi:N-methylhydantoinase B/oxoprolinase/acetone carboxylase alpha subunit
MRRATDGTLTTIGGLDDEGNWLPQMLGNIAFQPGESFVFESTGGGGWGPALERKAERVAEDVRNEIVSREKAEAVYGVVVTDDLELDTAATEQRRAARS